MNVLHLDMFDCTRVEHDTVASARAREAIATLARRHADGTQES